MEKNLKFHGAYSVRSIGKAQQGIQLPSTACGVFGVYSDDSGQFTLIPMGKKEGK